MPVEHGIGLDAKREERVFPLLNAAGEEDQPETVGLAEARFLSLALNAERDQWLAEQRILGDKLGFAPERVGARGEWQRVMSWLSEIEENSFEN